MAAPEDTPPHQRAAAARDLAFAGRLSDDAGWLADAQAYLRDRAEADRPFLLFVGFGGPHFPHDNAPADLKALYPPDGIELRRNVPDGSSTSANAADNA